MAQLTEMQRAVIPPCLDYDPFMSFQEIVWHAQIELDLIEEGQEAADCFTRAEIKLLRKFVADNRASLKAMTDGSY